MTLQNVSRWLWIVGLLAVASPASPQAENAGTPGTTVPPAADPAPRITAIDRTQAARADPITFTVAGDWSGPARIYLGGRQVGTAAVQGGKRFTWTVPGCAGACRTGDSLKDCPKSCEQCAGESCADCRVQVPLGAHDLQVFVSQGEETVLVPLPQGVTKLTIAKRTSGDPKITGVFPVPSYPDGSGYKVALQGEGLAENACDNEIYLGGELTDVCWGDAKTCESFADRPRAELKNGRRIELSNLGQADREIAQLALGVAGSVSEPVPIRLSRVARRTPLWWSLAGFAAIVALVVLVTSRGFKSDRIVGVRYNFGSALLLDKETDSYSLSRFQFYVWTAAAILGYLYLAISRSLVQGSLDFVDIPDGLPGIVLISAGTSVLAQWTQSLRGPKGAGNVRPSISDLITSGGVVAPERFQFFIWTVLGAGAFLALVVLRDPGTISDLPKVPEGFLQLMGVSSVGYLGGKMVRRPGPVLDEVVATNGSLVLTLRGRGLSVDASFRIGEDTVSCGVIAGENHKPRILEKDEQANDPTFAKVLELTITEPKEAWMQGAELTIVNPDGQKATWPYKVTSASAPEATAL